MSNLFNPGCEFVYEAVEYLRSEFLEFYVSLQSQHHTFLLEGAERTTETPVGDDRDSSPTVMFVRSASVMADMEEFDKYQKHKQFLDSSHLCDICAGEKKGLAFPEASLLCGHLFCTSCLAEYAQVSNLQQMQAHMNRRFISYVSFISELPILYYYVWYIYIAPIYLITTSVVYRSGI